ncbi:PD-(D/E)XK motif protein [Paenibacillus sp. GP183]|uniref:PD-(D/E)XK motif protein n=1 Tax=Paenibacillus sp. GP183 TaxID=1882751 RepID=UPI000895F7DC|nr:PD-(D/E)XK motif protein [Paenibacillus sp. GP183]SED14808.1 Putative PD-(D/E)XK family member [Paenibacillus sp. GP183]
MDKQPKIFTDNKIESFLESLEGMSKLDIQAAFGIESLEKHYRGISITTMKLGKGASNEGQPHLGSRLIERISFFHESLEARNKVQRKVLGNANIEKAAYSVLAEMLSYYYLLKQEKEVSWIGPFGGSVDFNCNDGCYEVKSTVARYGSQITINSQYQLKANYLLFYRFEPAGYGFSIQDMVTKLVELDLEESEIERALEKLNYTIGSEVRTKSYRLLEVMKYEIDESFPKIVPESFINGQLPKHISGLIYKLDLDGLNGEVIDLKEF